MSESAANGGWRGRLLLWLMLLVIAAAAAYFVSVCAQVIDAGSAEELHHADAIVVFGAAEYSGKPSPVYRARLDHAFDLYQQKLAPVVITTGGAAADPRYSEGGVGHDYLMHRGIPETSLIAETHGSDTAQSAERIAVIMYVNHMESCLAVSDAYHVFRIRKLLEHQGVEVYVAPRPGSRIHSIWQRAWAVSREATSYLVWKLKSSA